MSSNKIMQQLLYLLYNIYETLCYIQEKYMMRRDIFFTLLVFASRQPVTIIDLFFMGMRMAYLHLQKLFNYGFCHYKVLQQAMMNKKSLYLMFVLQIYISVESLEGKKDFLGLIRTCLRALGYTLVYFVLCFTKKSYCN